MSENPYSSEFFEKMRSDLIQASNKTNFTLTEIVAWVNNFGLSTNQVFNCRSKIDAILPTANEAEERLKKVFASIGWTRE